jgi:hypothetical protein
MAGSPSRAGNGSRVKARRALAQLHIEAVKAEEFEVWTLKADILRQTGISPARTEADRGALSDGTRRLRRNYRSNAGLANK